MKFVNNLTKEQESELLDRLGFIMYGNDIRLMGSEKIVEEESITYHTWDHNFEYLKDFENNYLKVNDFEVFRNGKMNKKDSNILRYFLYETFGKKYESSLNKYCKKQSNKSKHTEIEL